MAQALAEADAGERERERAVSLPLEEQLRQLPDAPGVYTFYDARGSLLYVGNISSARIADRWLFVEISPHIGERALIRGLEGTDIESPSRLGTTRSTHSPQYSGSDRQCWQKGAWGE